MNDLCQSKCTPFQYEPIDKDEKFRREYNRVEELIKNPITPNTLKNITLGFIKANIKDYTAAIANKFLPDDLVENLNNANEKIGNFLTLKK